MSVALYHPVKMVQHVLTVYQVDLALIILTTYRDHVFLVTSVIVQKDTLETTVRQRWITALLLLVLTGALVTTLLVVPAISVSVWLAFLERIVTMRLMSVNLTHVRIEGPAWYVCFYNGVVFIYSHMFCLL